MGVIEGKIMDVHKRMKPSSQFQWEKPYTSKIEALTRVVQLMKTGGGFHHAFNPMAEKKLDRMAPVQELVLYLSYLLMGQL